jgi:hypothetical protein
MSKDKAEAADKKAAKAAEAEHVPSEQERQQELSKHYAEGGERGDDCESEAERQAALSKAHAGK